jgi:hypothetical protein
VAADTEEDSMRRSTLTAGVLAMSLALGGCTGFQDPVANTTASGAGVGALAGAAIGSFSGNAGWGAVAGAGAGALGGYLFGQSRQNQQRAFDAGYAQGRAGR